MEDLGTGDGTPLAEGTALMRQGRFSEAAAILRRAVEESPADETAWRLLGGALASAGDTAGAVSAFEQAVALMPASARNHYNLAVGLQSAGRTAEARTHLEQALALDPDYQQARVTLESLGDGGEVSTDSGDRLSEAAEPRLAPLSPENQSFTQSESVSNASAYESEPVLSASSYNMPPQPPPPMIGQAYGSAYAPAPVNGTLILVFGVLSIVVCGILGPVAWIMGNNALRTLDTPGMDQTQRGSVSAGRICGIIGSVFLVLQLLYFVVVILAVIGGAMGLGS